MTIHPIEIRVGFFPAQVCPGDFRATFLISSFFRLPMSKLANHRLLSGEKPKPKIGHTTSFLIDHQCASAGSAGGGRGEQ